MLHPESFQCVCRKLWTLNMDGSPPDLTDNFQCTSRQYETHYLWKWTPWPSAGKDWMPMPTVVPNIPLPPSAHCSKMAKLTMVPGSTMSGRLQPATAAKFGPASYLSRGTDFPFQIFPFSVSEFNKLSFFLFSFLFSILCSIDVFSITHTHTHTHTHTLTHSLTHSLTFSQTAGLK